MAATTTTTCDDIWGDDICGLPYGHDGHHMARDDEAGTVATWHRTATRYERKPILLDADGDPCCPECGRSW
jgi:hypothetical protein